MNISDSYIDLNSSFTVQRSPQQIRGFRGFVEGLTYSWSKRSAELDSKGLRDFHLKYNEKKIMEFSIHPELEKFQQMMTEKRYSLMKSIFVLKRRALVKLTCLVLLNNIVEAASLVAL